jgi:pimeloyl-ACP methyl ester carboxylesterase
MKEFGVSESNLRENRVPTLALIGEIDPMRESVDALEAVMANVNIRVIPGAGHMNAFDAPEFTDGLLDFLSANRAN